MPRKPNGWATLTFLVFVTLGITAMYFLALREMRFDVWLFLICAASMLSAVSLSGLIDPQLNSIRYRFAKLIGWQSQGHPK